MNLFRRYRIGWGGAYSVFAGEGGMDSRMVSVARTKGRLWSVDVHASLGLGAGRQREIALQIAEVARGYGHGFPAGDGDDLRALHAAGLFETRDPATHEEWWRAREPDRSPSDQTGSVL